MPYTLFLINKCISMYKFKSSKNAVVQTKFDYLFKDLVVLSSVIVGKAEIFFGSYN